MTPGGQVDLSPHLPGVEARVRYTCNKTFYFINVNRETEETEVGRTMG